MSSILFVLPRFHPNLYVGTRALVAAGHRVTVFAKGSGQSEDHGIVTPRLFGAHPSLAEVRDAMEAAAPDLVLLRNAVGLSRNASVVAPRAGIPAYLYNQIPLTEPTTLRRRIDLWLRRLPVRRVTPVRGLDRDAPTDPFATYLPLPVAPLPAPSPPPAGPKLRVLCVGRFGTPRKNQLALFEEIAAAGLSDRIELTLVGTLPRQMDAAQARYHAALTEAAERQGARLRANLPYRAMGAVYAAAQVCVLPSTYETLGIAPVEGMAYGVVPVISRVCGCAGYIEPDRNGLLADMDRPGALGAQLRRLADDPALLARLSAGARATAEGDLGPDRFVERVEALIDR